MRGLIWLLAGAALSLSACAGSRPAAENRPPPTPSVLLSADALVFVNFDADNDLRLSAAELEAGIAREWRRADRDSDGSLTPLEFSDWSLSVLGGVQLPPYRLDFDRNVDNVITQTEFAAEFRARSEDYDANHDGFVTRAEMLRPAPQGRVQAVAPPPPVPNAGGDIALPDSRSGR